MNRTARHMFAAVAILSLSAQSLRATPTTTEFTYQGQLKDGGNLPNAVPYDFQFKLFDAATSPPGVQIGPTICKDNVQVANGLFTVVLDFGASPFVGDARWLEIGVRPGNVNVCTLGAYTTLSPRQPLTAAPYALFALANGMWATNGSSIHNVNTGNVGIGTLAPGAALEVVGSAIASHFMLTNTDVATPGPAIRFNAATKDWGIIASNAGSSSGDQKFIFRDFSGAQNRLVINAPGNVGIGTDNPQTRLQVENLLYADPSTSFVGVGRADRVTNAEYFGIQAPASGINYGGMYIRTDSATAKPFYGYAAGTETAWTYLDGSNGDWVLYNGGVRIAVTDTGNVGIPTTGSDVSLNVTASGGNVGIRAASVNDDAIQATCSGTGNAIQGVVGVLGQGTGNAGRFVNLNSSNTNPALYCSTNSAAPAFHADGLARVKVLEIEGADVAEKFPTTETLLPGMVVAIDPDHPGKLALSRGAYNRCVAGVVSGANGFSVGAILGNRPESEGGAPIALSGRVYVHCDTSDHAIEPGDLLTTAELPGHAMKVIDIGRAQGAVIGKAMTRLEKGGRGFVLVLVNLQ